MKVASLGAVVVAGAGLLAFSEFVHWWGASRGLSPVPPPPGGDEAIIVLGYPGRSDGGLHPLQRWRTDIAVRSMDPSSRSSTLIFTGWGGHEGQPSEASVMARYAMDHWGIGEDQIVLEERARSTWQNIEYSLPFAERADAIKVASNSLHAWRARRYLRAMRPDLIDHVAPSASYYPLERWRLKILLTVYEFWAATIKRIFW